MGPIRRLACYLSVIAFLLSPVLILSACGSGNTAAKSQNSDGFINEANGAVSDARLLELWQDAQAQLATTPFSLNPVAVLLKSAANMLAGPDGRSYQVRPVNVHVIAVPDIPVAQLPAEFQNGAYKDPSGVIANCNDVVHYCHASTHGNTIYVAVSLATSEGATGWEFQNVILARLGYDVSGR